MVGYILISNWILEYCMYKSLHFIIFFFHFPWFSLLCFFLLIVFPKSDDCCWCRSFWCMAINYSNYFQLEKFLHNWIDELAALSYRIHYSHYINTYSSSYDVYARITKCKKFSLDASSYFIYIFIFGGSRYQGNQTSFSYMISQLILIHWINHF